MIEQLLPQASSFANEIDWLFSLIFWTVGFWFMLAQAAFFYLLFKFRRRDGVKAQYVAGEDKSEKRWISIPHFLVIGCDVVIIVFTVLAWQHVKQDMPEADATVRIVGQQWAWTFVHPGPDGKLDTNDDITTIDELHVRKDTTYHFELSSTDVLHSFSVPVFRLKQDAVPGRTIKGWFKPTLEGEFDIQCAEMCGIGHGLMAARISIENAEQHDRWMSEHAG